MSDFTADSDMTDENIATVKEYIGEFPAQRQRVLDAEREGQNRTTLVAWLEEEQSDEQPEMVPDPNPLAPEPGVIPASEFRSP